MPLRQSSKLIRLRHISSALEYIRTHRTQMIALIEIVANYRTAEGNLRFGGEGEEPILADLEALLRKGQQEGDFCLFDLRVMAMTIRRAIDVVPPSMQPIQTDVASFSRELVMLFDRATRKV